MSRKLKVDDPVGAVGVHGICGALGTIMVGLFSDGTGTDGLGLLLGGGFKVLGVQLLGLLAVGAWTAVTVTILFFAIKKLHGLRVEPAVELSGLDVSEHGLESSYADFMPAPSPDMAPVAASVNMHVESTGRRYEAHEDIHRLPSGAA